MGRTRYLLFTFALGAMLAGAQDQPPPKPSSPSKPPAAGAKPPATQDPVEVEPPEEDESLKPKVYSFNPLEAKNDLRVGETYYKKGNFKAAAKRFEEATLYDPSLADAFLRLGDAREKLHDKKGAKAAYGKYVELKPEAKAGLKKKIEE